MELPIIHQEIWKSESGMMCLVRRFRRYSMVGPLSWQWWCGYVVIPHDHPLYGISNHCQVNTGHDPSCRSCFLTHVLVHGGITFAGFIGEDWCVGFDMNHSGDQERNWQLEDCQIETERLAKQIAAAYPL